ncbi:uncharacterized protein LOC142008338 [Carettochelys insculpta]|uniref:uncharacterized protein LOC142008338 n=1 Tax=Carettochelys insculpta TaxID=44489 RepID=UPI003EB991EE
MINPEWVDPADDEDISYNETVTHLEKPNVNWLSRGTWRSWQNVKFGLRTAVIQERPRVAVQNAETAPSEGHDSVATTSVVPDSPPRTSHRGSQATEQGPALGQAHHRRSQPQATADPRLLATLWHHMEVSERYLQVEKHWLHVQERVLAWCQEAWGAFMSTFEQIAEWTLPTAAPSAVPPRRPPPALQPTKKKDRGAQEPARPYLPVFPAPTQPQRGLWPRRGLCPPNTGHWTVGGRGLKTGPPRPPFCT